MARSRFRSVRYDLAASLEVARLADSAGGSIAPDLLAPALGYSGTNNGAYLSRVASARLFGVVTGRGGRLELTERGRQILAGVEPEASRSRRDAFLAVPLFRAVADAVESNGGYLSDELAHWLVDELGEVEDKARPAADHLVASAGQAGLIRRDEKGKLQLTTSVTNFTAVENNASQIQIGQLGWRRGSRSSTEGTVAMAEDGLWLDEGPDRGSKQPRTWRRAGIAGVAALILVVVAVPVALVAGGSTPKPTASHTTGKDPRLGNGQAEHQVLSALSATTDSGSFDFTYAISSTPASSASPTTTSTTACQEEKVPVPTGSTSVGGVSTGTNGGGIIAGGSSSSSSGSSSFSVSSSSAVSVYPSSGSASGTFTPGSGSLPPGFQWKTEKVCNGPVVAPSPDVNGSGVINTNPLAMVASANIGGGLDVVVRVNGSDVYEEGTGDTGLAPMASDQGSSGSTLPGFAGITEGTLGDREGAVAMMGMSSPTGYLDLIQPAVSSATETGSGSVGGVAVTNYTVSNDLDQLAGAAGTSSAEAQTVTSALTLLKSQGYTTNSAVVSIDAAGFIRQVKSTDTFSDGGTVTLLASFSNFGCAGTILMPGQTGAGVPPAGCTSPDSPNSSTTTSTAPAPNIKVAPTTIPASTATTIASPSTTTASGASTTSTDVPGSGSSSTTSTAPPVTSSPTP
jgi:hypothetical protein